MFTILKIFFRKARASAQERGEENGGEENVGVRHDRGHELLAFVSTPDSLPHGLVDFVGQLASLLLAELAALANGLKLDVVKQLADCFPVYQIVVEPDYEMPRFARYFVCFPRFVHGHIQSALMALLYGLLAILKV